MRKNILVIIYLILFLTPRFLFSQVTISGPTCVTTETVYQYNIQGSWDSASTMQVCITGGAIADSGLAGNCTSQKAPFGSVRVTWNDLSGGSLSVNSSKGNASLDVNVTTALQPGLIDSAWKFQAVDSGIVPHAISCLPAAGGACEPHYSWQWQQSADAGVWSDISGAINPALSFLRPVDQPTYYRRKVTETVSGTITYTDAAMIYVTTKTN